MMTGTAPPPDATEAIGPFTLWAAVLGGLAAWLVRLVAGSVLVAYACLGGRTGTLVLYGASVAGLVITGVALVLCLRIIRRVAAANGDESWSGAGLAARVGVLMNAIAAALIVAESVAIPLVPACWSV